MGKKKNLWDKLLASLISTREKENDHSASLQRNGTHRWINMAGDGWLALRTKRLGAVVLRSAVTKYLALKREKGKYSES